MAAGSPQHRGGSNATTIGMVVSIVVAVLLLAALIILFTQQEQLKNTADQAIKTKERLARGGEESAAKQMFPDAGGPGKTLVGEMNKGFQLICGRMAGDQTIAPQAAVKKLDVVLDEIKENVPDAEQVSSAYGAATIIENLYGMFRNEQAAREKSEAELEKANANLEAVLAAKEELGNHFKAELAKLSDTVGELQRAKDNFENIKGAEVAALARQIGDKQDALDAMRRNQSKLLRKFRAEIAHRERSIDEQSEALALYRGQGTARAAEPLSIACEPVGTVLRALPGDSLVHIDLGKRDKVTLGMTFSVYSAEERIDPEGRGKAHIEVVGLGERTAECKVTTPPSPDDPILPGDRVGNIVLNRNREKTTQICILGQFDIDGDGHVDVRGTEAIRALAKRYGAEVVDTVDAMTDYVVVGLEPPAEADDYAREEIATEDEEDELDEEMEDEDEYEDEDEDEFDEDETDEDEDELDEDETDEDEDELDEDEADEDEDELDEDEADEDEDELDEDEADEDEDELDEEMEDEDEDEDADENEDDADSETLAPSIKRETEIDPTTAPRKRRIRSEREKYFEAIRRAEMFGIPRLRQDQFFNFIGIEIGPNSAKQLLG